MFQGSKKTKNVLLEKSKMMLRSCDKEQATKIFILLILYWASSEGFTVFLTKRRNNETKTKIKCKLNGNFSKFSKKICFVLTLPVPVPDEEKKLRYMFIFTLLCDASKGFMKASKAFIELFEATQKSVKIRI